MVYFSAVDVSLYNVSTSFPRKGGNHFLGVVPAFSGSCSRCLDKHTAGKIGDAMSSCTTVFGSAGRGSDKGIPHYKQTVGSVYLQLFFFQIHEGQKKKTQRALLVCILFSRTVVVASLLVCPRCCSLNTAPVPSKLCCRTCSKTCFLRFRRALRGTRRSSS